MSRKKVSTTIYITPEQADRLKMLHERTKVPISVYIREGIDMILKHYEHVLPGQMSLEAQSVGVARLAPTPVPPQVQPASPTPAPPPVAPIPAPPPSSPAHAHPAGRARAEAAPKPSPSQEEAVPKTVAGSGPRGGQRAHKQSGSSRPSGDGTS